MAKDCNYRSSNFDRLSKELLDVDLHVDDWRILATDWKADKVSEDAINHATKSVQVSIELFKMFEEKLVKEKYLGNRAKFIDEICQEYSNEDFPKKKPENDAQAQDETIELSKQNIQVVSNAEECKTAVEQLLSYVPTWKSLIETDTNFIELIFSFKVIVMSTMFSVLIVNGFRLVKGRWPCCNWLQIVDYAH